MADKMTQLQLIDTSVHKLDELADSLHCGLFADDPAISRVHQMIETIQDKEAKATCYMVLSLNNNWVSARIKEVLQQ